MSPAASNTSGRINAGASAKGIAMKMRCISGTNSKMPGIAQRELVMSFVTARALPSG